MNVLIMKFRRFVFYSIFIYIYANVVFEFVNNTITQDAQMHRNRTGLSKKYASSVQATSTYSLQNLMYSEKDIYNDSAAIFKENTDQKLIILFNVPGFMKYSSIKEKLYQRCDYRNCVISRNKGKLIHADAIIFFIGVRDERMGENPPIKSNIRNPNQVWIFTSVEPPEHYYNTDYQLTSWHNTMNWSILYRLDSDIPNPYGCLIRQPIPDQRNYISIYRAKTKNAVWIVSHCQVASGRRQYVNEMIKHGFDVDILGGCGPDGKQIGNKDIEEIMSRYKFYLGFENSFCNDYITEKFFKNYNYNGIVIVRGGADYHRLLPTQSFINTSDFTTVYALVKFLLNLGNHQENYIAFLRKKDSYTSVRWPGNTNCEICRRLNNLNKFRKTYNTISDYLNKNQCKRPTDI